MNLSKYFLSVFAVLVAISGSLASFRLDFYVGSEGIINAIPEHFYCDANNNGTICVILTHGGGYAIVYDNLTSGGTNVDLHSELRAQYH